MVALFNIGSNFLVVEVKILTQIHAALFTSSVKVCDMSIFFIRMRRFLLTLRIQLKVHI